MADAAQRLSAVVLDSRTLQSTPTSGGRAGYDGAKRKKGSKVHMAVDTLGHLLTLHVTPANEQDRDQVAQLARAVQEATQQQVELAYVDQGYTAVGSRTSGSGARHHARSGEIAEGQARVRSTAAALGGRAQLRLGRSLSPSGTRL